MGEEGLMEGEIIVVAGPPGGGKSTAVKHYMAQGFTRLNRDEIGGSLRANGALFSHMRTLFREYNERRFVLDNTHGTVKSRAVVIAAARELGLPVHIKWLETTLAQAQFFAARRQIQRYDKLFAKDDYKTYRDDPNMFPPAAQFAFFKRVEVPTTDEGFASVEMVPVEIDLGSEYVNRAIIIDYDDTVRRTKSGAKWPCHPDDVVVIDGCGDVLQRKQAEGYLLLGASNQSGVSRKTDDPKYVSPENLVRCFKRTHDLLGVDIDCLYAPDRGGVPQTYWRKPCPGMGAVFIERYKLQPSQCIYVGDRKTDATFSSRCGFQFAWAHEFFA
jgi:HAD superfamily hydrolase (TIGR01662 family)